MEDPSFFNGDHFGHLKQSDFIYNNNNTQFAIDDLLVDFPSHEDVVLNDDFFDNVIGNSVDSSAVTAVDSCNSSVAGNVSSRSFSDSQFSGVELCLPYDDVADLEWLSSFTHESFSTVEVQNLQLNSTVTKSPATDTSSSGTTPGFGSKPAFPYRINSHISQTDVFVPGKARSKRSRSAPYDWASRILHVKPKEMIRLKKREVPESLVMRCLHCGSDKTPQWRTGPMGPKTLCNACGVRYKSGRLVPEYRPAASPTFVSAKHSNSHRKVMEIRRQKELRNAHNGFVNRGSGLIESNGGDDCLIERHGGPSYMHMI
ncbi:GATA transcription factor 9-like [Bidens hawaiensis]|uniref:GATA transcription factor 9-like n=1 Tax=Bidens hawaiensis TaxID=980011 RepID=UPI004049893E